MKKTITIEIDIADNPTLCGSCWALRTIRGYNDFFCVLFNVGLFRKTGEKDLFLRCRKCLEKPGD